MIVTIYGTLRLHESQLQSPDRARYATLQRLSQVRVSLIAGLNCDWRLVVSLRAVLSLMKQLQMSMCFESPPFRGQLLLLKMTTQA